MTNARFDGVDRLMHQAIETSVFPGAVLLIARHGAVQFLEAYGRRNLLTRQVVTTDTLFDLASLTKPLVTTPALMLLAQQSKLALDEPIGSHQRWLKGTDKEAITIRALLNHTAGLPAYRPFYRDLQQVDSAGRKEALKQALAKVPLEAKPGQTVYSDLGFILLGLLVEEITQQRLDAVAHQLVFAPLGIGCKQEPRLFFSDASSPSATVLENVAATEICPWRNRLLEGVVHDENAFVMGGVAGHAGLFGDALGVFHLARAMADAYSGRQPGGWLRTETLQRFFRRDARGSRPLGFDSPSEADASCGRHFSDNTVGHLGFTGTSLWMDLDQAVIVVLLTNRVHPSRRNERIRSFRPRLHDAVMEAFFLVKTG
jgi:CubicO group peptidase (beta-lactamase class C family)